MLYRLRKNRVSIKNIATFLKINYTGKNFYVDSVSSLDNIIDNSLFFYFHSENLKIKNFREYQHRKNQLEKVKKFKNVILITNLTSTKFNMPVLFSNNPRLDFYRVTMNFFINDEFKNHFHKTATIEKNSFIGKNVFIGANCYIGNDVRIGDNTKILQNTCIFGKTDIGSNCVIKSNTTIGSEGFGFVFTGKELFHLPHLGSIVIGNNVWIGSNSTIEKSHLDQTTIEDHVKIDDLVQIGHNSIIKKFSQITSGCIIAGRVQIGERCWISPNSVIDIGCHIGENCVIGTNSLVRTNFPKNSVIFGSPAKFVRRKI